MCFSCNFKNSNKCKPCRKRDEEVRAKIKEWEKTKTQKELWDIEATVSNMFDPRMPK